MVLANPFLYLESHAYHEELLEQKIFSAHSGNSPRVWVIVNVSRFAMFREGRDWGNERLEISI